MNEKEFIEISELVHEWRDVVGYEGLYKVNEYGDVIALNYRRTGQKRLLKPKMNTVGYMQVGLNKNGKSKYFLVHRLVATAFCEGAEYFPEVNHIDEDKTNNHYENLEWCTREYNNNYGTIKDRLAEAHKKKVRCIELNIIFGSVKEASEYIETDPTSISACLRGRQKTTCGYHWEYVD